MVISNMSRANAIAIFNAGVESVKPHHFIPRFIQSDANSLKIGDWDFCKSDFNNLYVAAVGKASAAMALETEKIFGNLITEGLVVTKYHHALPLRHCNTIEAGHPVPDHNSLIGGTAIVELFEKATANDLIILLISGGASALIADTPPGSSLEDLQQTAQLLLDSGAAIDEMNTIRKHLSRIKGGQLMTFTQATVVALVLSDVPGDDLSVIASGLTVPDPGTFQDAWNIIEKFGLNEKLPPAISNRLTAGINKLVPDTPKPGSPAFLKVHNFLVASNQTALEAASQKATELGYTTRILSPMLTGEAEQQADFFVRCIAEETANAPVCVLWGGETTVTIRGNGKGGRNQHFALAALCELQKTEWAKHRKVTLLAGGTDGTDGPTDAAGALVDFRLWERPDAGFSNPEMYLYNNDAYHFFEKTGCLVKTGPTQTNVMDIVVGLID